MSTKRPFVVFVIFAFAITSFLPLNAQPLPDPPPCAIELLSEDFGATTPAGWEGDFMLLAPPLIEGWNFYTGPTHTPNTGPDAAFSTGYYMYLETNGPAPLNAIYKVRTPPIDLFGANSSLRFMYLMYGAQVGSLKVNVLSGPGYATSETVVNIVGEQHTSGDVSNWTEAAVDLSHYDQQTVKIEFEGMKNGGELGDIAVDRVRICIQRQIPTLGEWGIIILGLTLMIFGVTYIRSSELAPVS